MSGQEYGRRRRRRRREDVQLLIECLPQPWALSAALTNQTLSPVGLFPLPAKVFRSAGTASIAEEKGCLLRYKMVKQRRAGRKLSKGRGNVVRMSVIPFVCCARRQGLAVSRARYQTIYNTAVDYTELKGRKRQCACDRVRELVHVAPCVFVPSCRAGRDVSIQWLVGLAAVRITDGNPFSSRNKNQGSRTRLSLPRSLERRQRRENSKQT